MTPCAFLKSFSFSRPPRNIEPIPLIELFKELDSTKQKLTPKEREIAEFYTEGLSLTDIMKKLEISKSTINTHMESIRSKFQVNSNREIITKYQIGRLKSIEA